MKKFDGVDITDEARSDASFPDGQDLFKRYCVSLKDVYKPNKKMALIQIPQFLFDSFNPQIARRRGYYAFPPSGLQYLYEAVKDRDLEVKILDLNFLLLKTVVESEAFDINNWLSILSENLEKFEPGIIGVSCMYDSGIKPLTEILRFLKRRDNAVVITGGVIAGYESEHLLKNNLCHFAVRGEGENRINYLLDNITDHQTNQAPTDGIFFKVQDEYCESVGSGAHPEFDFDLISSYSHINASEYHKYGSLNPFSRIAGINKSPYGAVQFSRGCRGNCSFCAVSDLTGKGVRKKSVDKIIAEMEHLINSYGVKHIEWLDDDLLAHKKDVKKILQTIIDRNWRITWSANNGLIAASIDDELMALMRDSGCIGFKVGVETGNAEMLKKIRKPGTLDSFRKSAKLFQNYPEIFIGGNFIVGFPDEKFSQMTDSFLFYLELDLDWAAFTVCQAVRGATAFDDYAQYFTEQMVQNGQNVKNFIPTRHSSLGSLDNNDNVLKNLEIFSLDPESRPSQEQIGEIWFTFNLTANFINNKNLRPGGNVRHFISWVKSAQTAYPDNPYMRLFLALAYLINGENKNARENHLLAARHADTETWRDRFGAFGLDKVISCFPANDQEAFDAIEKLRNYCQTFYSEALT